MRATDTVSVIIPVYDGARYLGAAIASVLAQTCAPHEIIVVDDGSRDGSAGVAEGFAPRVRTLRCKHGGISAARNTGIAAAHGQYLALLDADDLWLPDKLAQQMEAMRGSAAPDIVFTQMVQFLSPDLDEATAQRRVCPAGAAPGITASCVLMRRAVFESVGPFRTDVVSGEFIDWYTRARELGMRTFVVPEALTRRRVHASNHGVRERDARQDYLRVLKDSLDRRRAATRPPDASVT